MSIKFANEIVREIVERGTISIPKYAATGEDYENWLYDEEEKKIDNPLNKKESRYG